MDVVGNIKSLMELWDRLAEKRKKSEEETTLTKVLIAIYKLGDGRASADVEDLQKLGFTKMQIFEATRLGLQRRLLIDATSFDGQAWLLSLDGISWVEAVLEEMGQK